MAGHLAKIINPNPNEVPRFNWVLPEFSPVDGIAEQDGLAVMGGLVLAFGFVDDNGANSCGSGVMVAPGVMVTATHVAEATRNAAGMAYSFLAKRKMRLWAPKEIHYLCGPTPDPFLGGSVRRRTSDVCLTSCTLMSNPITAKPINMAHLAVAIPEKGERLWAVGYRKITRDRVPKMTMYCSSGLVKECYLEGRGNHLPGPCVEVAMNAVGGMSGGPVFNSEGYVIGIVSTAYETDDMRGPTFVSLIWPAIIGEVTAPWPPGFWPNGEANLKWAHSSGYARVHGDVTIGKDGRFSGKCYD